MKALRNEGSGENGTARSMRVPMWIWREIQARASDLGVSTEKALTGMLSEYLHQKALDSRRAHSKMDDEHGQPHDFWKQRQSVMEGAL